MSAYRAIRTPVHRGPAAWSMILPGQAAPRPLEGDAAADVVLVGAGFAGLAAARRLKQLDPKARVLVVEAGRIAEGASGRNSGFMIDLPHELTSDDYAGHGAAGDKALIALNRGAIAFAREAVEDYDIPRDWFDPIGKTNGAASDTADALNARYAAHLASMGEPCERLDAQAMAEMTGSRHYRSGLYTPGTVLIQPAGYVRAFAEGLRRGGVIIAEQTPVLSFARKGAAWEIVTPRGKVSTGKVILTNNGHLESFGFAKGCLMHVFLFASMTAPLDNEALRRLGGRPRWGITPSDPMGTTMRRIDGPLGGERIVTRTCGVFAPGMQVGEADVRRTAAVHRRKFEERFPMLKGAPMEYSWAGHLCLTRNGVAVMKRLDQGLYSACVQNGLGTVRGTLTGVGAAELACGVESPITRRFLAEPAPPRLPPRPLSTIGANIYLRWKERLADQE